MQGQHQMETSSDSFWPGNALVFDVEKKQELRLVNVCYPGVAELSAFRPKRILETPAVYITQ